MFTKKRRHSASIVSNSKSVATNSNPSSSQPQSKRVKLVGEDDSDCEIDIDIIAPTAVDVVIPLPTSSIINHLKANPLSVLSDHRIPMWFPLPGTIRHFPATFDPSHALVLFPVNESYQSLGWLKSFLCKIGVNKVPYYSCSKELRMILLATSGPEADIIFRAPRQRHYPRTSAFKLGSLVHKHRESEVEVLVNAIELTYPAPLIMTAPVAHVDMLPKAAPNDEAPSSSVGAGKRYEGSFKEAPTGSSSRTPDASFSLADSATGLTLALSHPDNGNSAHIPRELGELNNAASEIINLWAKARVQTSQLKTYFTEFHERVVKRQREIVSSLPPSS